MRRTWTDALVVWNQENSFIGVGKFDSNLQYNNKNDDGGFLYSTHAHHAVIPGAAALLSQSY